MPLPILDVVPAAPAAAMPLPSSSISSPFPEAIKKAPLRRRRGPSGLPSPGVLSSLHLTYPLADKAHAIDAPGHIRGGGVNGCDLGDEEGHV